MGEEDEQFIEVRSSGSGLWPWLGLFLGLIFAGYLAFIGAVAWEIRTDVKSLEETYAR